MARVERGRLSWLRNEVGRHGRAASREARPLSSSVLQDDLGEFVPVCNVEFDACPVYVAFDRAN
jgi:hypothetical protein